MVDMMNIQGAILGLKTPTLPRVSFSFNAWLRSRDGYRPSERHFGRLIERNRGPVGAIDDYPAGTRAGRQKSLIYNTFKDHNRRIVFVKCSHCGLELETMSTTELKYA